MTVWDEEGISSFSYNPAMNFKGEPNKFINNLASSAELVKDSKGNYYYVSHPPLAYYLPYTVFNILHLKPSVLNIQFVNLAIHFFSALFVYLIARQFIETGNKYRNRISLMAYVLYLFLPVTLWFHSNVYMSDMLVMLFVLSSIYLYIAFTSKPDRIYCWLYAVSVFLMVYTSWLGIFFAGTMIAFQLLLVNQPSERIKVVMLTLFPTALAIILFVWQYAQINGLEMYLDHLMHRYQERGSGSEGSFIFEKLNESRTIIINLITSYGALLLFLIFVWFYLKLRKIRISNNSFQSRIVWLCFIPVVLLNVVLMNYSGHDFVSLYFALFFILLFVLSANSLLKKYKQISLFFNVGFVVSIVISIGMYYVINLPGSHSWKGDRYDSYYNLGNKIKNRAGADEVVFIKGINPEPQLTFYAHRNIKRISNDKEALEFLKLRKLKKGFIISSAKDKQYIEFKHIENKL